MSVVRMRKDRLTVDAFVIVARGNRNSPIRMYMTPRPLNDHILMILCVVFNSSLVLFQNEIGEWISESTR